MSTRRNSTTPHATPRPWCGSLLAPGARVGEPLLLSNGSDGNGVANLSFEREFGKLIGNQDTLAKIVEDKSNRAIRFGVVNLTSMVFLPI